MALQPVRRHRMVDEVVRRLLDLVSGAPWAPDRPLPSERVLAERLRVSRPVIREAMGALEGMGVVTVIHGRGRFLGPLPANGAIPSWLLRLPRHRKEVLHLLQVREALESLSVRLAAVRRKRADLARLRANLARTRRATASPQVDKRLMQTLDTEFHTRLAAASGNPFLETLITLIVAALREEREDLFAVPGRPEQSLRAHEAIVEAVAAGDPETAVRALRDHAASVRATVDAVTALARSRRRR
ncbi:MAG: FCD domain-containing protein [Armatimonadota bacterium]|nr:FCD domain-containing protein [Armatimonadota bacterium]MDR7496508.1 FCD domain-containing protein [Armatimonadota bacterium]MDR7512968.1 FCD domain-containing protein [Armatimonadota bacterium]